MAEFIVRNSLNPSKVVKFGITFTQLVAKGAEGESVWLIQIATDEKDINGNTIRPEFIHLTSFESLSEEVDNIVAKISEKIDWGPLQNDERAPFIDEVSPTDYEVSINSRLEMKLKELLPAAGIDIDSISMTVNGFDVTDELNITGNPYSYDILWKPFMRVFEEE